jgi:hypothetical protein
MDESDWPNFPNFEKFLSAERPQLLDSIEATCRRLDDVVRTGSPQEKARAQTALTGYARALQLYRQLAEMRDKAALEASNKAKQHGQASTR